jgi:L-asparaginase
MLRPAHGYLEHMLRTVPEFLHPDVPSYDVLEWATLLDSSDFSPQCWVTLAEQIDRHYYDYDGFVVRTFFGSGRNKAT